MDDDIFLPENEVKPSDEFFAEKQKEGRIDVADFRQGKYISTVSDDDDVFILDDNKRYKYLAAYVKEKDHITGIKLQRFIKKGSNLEADPLEFNLPFKQSNSITDFLKFLTKANLGTLSSGKFILADALVVDTDLYSKLVTLSRDKSGQNALSKLFEEGYLTSNLDIPDLIKKGLSREKIEEKLKKIEAFETLISKNDVKEVADIHNALQNMPWIFGPEYESIDIRGAGDAGIPDRRLKRIDGLSDILEVKLPSAELLRKDNLGRNYIAPDLSEAIGQLTGYLEHYFSVYTEERDDKTGQEILEDRYGKYYKPKGILLIGRRNKSDGTITTQKTDNAEPKSLRRLMSYYHWIEVLTYDDLIERARNSINNLLSE
ncbi:MAG: Shedu anti-phage system protein SduA domain-containing protein [Minisyncoccota bacterium]